MRSQLLIDNWTLQSCSELLSSGLQGDTSADLLVGATSLSSLYEDISADVVRIEALFQSLNDVVFSDELLLDVQFSHTWSQFGALQPLLENRIIITKPLLEVKSRWVPLREAIAAELCTTQVLLERHAENIASWKSTRTSVDGFFSQLVWGGAGMLARADFLKLPYSAHPSRATLFRRAGLFPISSGAHEQLEKFVNSERVKIFKNQKSGINGAVILPPAVVQILSEAVSVSDLFKVAIDLRNEYADIRRWIAQFQHALDCENAKELLSREKLLRSVTRDLDTLSSPSVFGDVSMQFGAFFPKLSVKLGSPISAIAKHFGIRAQIKRLICAQAGRKAFRRMLHLFGEEKSKLGRSVEREFFRRSAVVADKT